jgi:arylsulfatase A-like enzyme
LGGLLLLGSRCQLLAQAPPNVVVFLVDDMGWTDWQYDATLNPTGSKVYETPNLLTLAQRSVSFTNAYAPAPVCSPTRASLLTGKSPARTRLTDYLPGGFVTTANLKQPPNWTTLLPGPTVQPNIVNTLKNNGYATSLFGKWHLGSADPSIYGFQTNVGGNSSGGPTESGGWFAGPDGGWPLPGLDTNYPSDKYLSDAVTEKAVDYISTHANQAQPIFLYKADYQVHNPIQAPQNLINKYQTKINTLQGQGEDLKGHTNATYAAMVEKMDGDVGAILNRLDDPNQDNNHDDSVLNNTIFVFTSDNGGSLDDAGNITRNSPLREGKGSLYEGGVRVPLMISYGADANIAQGTRTNARTSLYDLYPTLFDLTGKSAAMPANNPIDGVSIRAALEGQAFDRGYLFWHYPHRSPQDSNSGQVNGGSFVSAVSDKDWKLLFFYDDRHYELYNLTSDISETTNLLAMNPGVAHDLSLALRNFLTNSNALMPVCNTTAPGNAAGCTTLNAPVDLPTLLATPIAGDYNGDSLIDIDDYNQWQSDFGSTTSLRSDGNHNGVVDAGDYVFWRNIFNLGSGAGSGSSVPEPAALLLTSLAMFFSAALPTRRRR